MQRFLNTLLVMMLYLVSSTSSAQQFESFRNIGEVSGNSAGTVTSVTLTSTNSQISFFNAAGLSIVYDVVLEPSRVISDEMPVFMPSPAFGQSEDSMNLDNVSFLTGSLVDSQNPDADVPAHWFRITSHNGVFSGAFRIADRIYSIDRSDRNNIVEVRATPSQTQTLQPTRQIKVSALVDEDFVFADAPGDSVGMDSLGHIFALESLHAMEAVLNDSMGISLRVEQLIYQTSAELTPPSTWLESNATSFGVEDNFASFFFLGSNSGISHTGFNYVALGKPDFEQLSTAHYFGEQLAIVEESATLQSSTNPLNYAHWSESQRDALLVDLEGASLVQIISFDTPEIGITEPEEPFNQIPQSILDSEIVEISDAIEEDTVSNTGILQSDDTGNSNLAAGEPEPDSGGGGLLPPASILCLMLISMLSRRRNARVHKPTGS